MPIYIHAKLCIVDDVWVMAGSDNFNRRSWTHDSELSIAILDTQPDEREPHDPGGFGDGARVLARNTRIDLWREHLERNDVPVDPANGFRMMSDSAAALDAWYDHGQLDARPPGRLRRHRPTPVAWSASPLAESFYRLVGDPDGCLFLVLRRRGAY